MPTKRFRVDSGTGIHKRLQKLFNTMDDLDLKIGVNFGRIEVVDIKDGRHYELNGSDGGLQAPYDLPPTFDWKLNFYKEKS